MTIEVDPIEKRVLAQALVEFAKILKSKLTSDNEDTRRDAAEDLDVLEMMSARIENTKLPALSEEAMESQTKLARGIVASINIEERLKALLNTPVRNPELWIKYVQEQGQLWVANDEHMRQQRKDTPYRISSQLSAAITYDHLLEFYITKLDEEGGIGLMYGAMGEFGPDSVEYKEACKEYGRRISKHTAITTKIRELRRGEEPTNWPTS